LYDLGGYASSNDIIACILLLESQHVYALIDPNATHSSIARKWEDKLKVQPKCEKRVVISTPLGEIVLIEYVYKGYRVKIGDVEMRVDLLPLDLYE